MTMNSTREQLLKRRDALKSERNSWMAHWRELSDYILPRRGRFLTSDRNRGSKKNDLIINNTPTRAARILASGLMAGITSPARPWFRLTTPDPDLAEFGAVRSWLHTVEERMRMAFARSNIYNALATLYLDLPVFGTSPMIVDEDAEDILRAYVQPAGQYMLANSSRMQVDTIYRDMSLTVAQMATLFGIKNCSNRVQGAFREGRLDEYIEVIHAVEPNLEFDRTKKDHRGKRWRSVWFEEGSPDSGHEFLREKGYEDFCCMAPRWSVTGEDVYGTSPAMDALGDAKALQHLEKRSLMLVDKLTNPPMTAPFSLANKRQSLLPGDTTYLPDNAQTGFRPAHEIQPVAIQIVDQKIREHEQRINAAFYVDLFLMLTESDRRQITAREIDERHEEKMLQLGPVLERLEDELLDPLVDRGFGIMLRRNLLPQPPEELQGVELRVEYISILAQAQKLLGTTSVERLASFVGNLVAVKPDVLDKIDLDETVDTYADMLGVKPALIVPDDKVQQLRAQRAQQQAQAAAMQNMSVAAQGAKTLSETDTGSDNALTRLMGSLGGVAAAVVPGGGAQ